MGPNGDGRPRPQRGPMHGSQDHPEPAPPGGVPARSEVMVRPGTQADAGTVAVLHASQITEGFLSFLGPRFLRRLYRRIGLSPDCFLLIADEHGETVGFIAGSTDVARLYRSFLLRDGIPATVFAVGRLVTGWRRMLETLRHGSSDGAGSGRGTELLAVAVDRAHQGQGAGRMLVGAFLDEVTAQGNHAAHVVVGAANHDAVTLYARAGFVEIERFELHPGTESLLMQWDRSEDRRSTPSSEEPSP